MVGECECDDSYECECGEKFTTKSNMAAHFTMPDFIAGKRMPETIEVNLPDMNL
jgi:hypothetical protein